MFEIEEIDSNRNFVRNPYQPGTRLEHGDIVCFSLTEGQVAKRSRSKPKGEFKSKGGFESKGGSKPESKAKPEKPLFSSSLGWLIGH